VPTTQTAQEELFALHFLAQNERQTQSIIDYMLTRDQETPLPFTELKKVGLILGNLALDGISAREMLV